MEYKLSYPLSYKRRETREVYVGKIGIGGNNPIRVQSMVTCHTHDVENCFSEIKELHDVGCEIIRLTIPTKKDLDAVADIKRRMEDEGIHTPLVADIHFLPQLAESACELFEKVRINPGNYIDKPKNSSRKRTGSFEEGKEILRESIQPLINNLKRYNRALRIGVNHGSLSSRMIEEFGDSPLGMVESALEMIEIFEEADFKHIIVSLKSSNPLVAQKAYRLLAERLPKKNSIPFHLGVTEAGDGELARIKSLTGIGSLLTDGIGDTIRVSLTEDSKNEIIFAKQFLPELFDKPNTNKNRKVFLRSLSEYRANNDNSLSEEVGHSTSLKLGITKNFYNPGGVTDYHDFFYEKKPDQILELDLSNKVKGKLIDEDKVIGEISNNTDSLIFHSTISSLTLREIYSEELNQSKPVGLFFRAFQPTARNREIVELSKMLSEGLIDFVLLDDLVRKEDLDSLFLILQATRNKIFQTDYIACPSCGRTLFDLQETTKKIKQKTLHLTGVKIGIMGCVVNGPGEMADADFGYVGSGPGKIDLYLGQDRVKRGVPEGDAVSELVNLIKENDCWIEPKN